MAINPTRPDGSYLFNRFTGAIVQAVAPGVTPSGEVPFGDPIPGTSLVKFGPFEGVSARPQQYLGNGGRTNCPGYPVPGPLSGSPYAEQTWAQSTQVLAKSLDGNSGLIEIDPVTPFEKDPTTGMPIVRLYVTLSALPAEVDIQVRMFHSVIR